MTMGTIRMGPPTELILHLKDRHKLSASFVETGTYHGDTSAWASEHFDSVITIEYSKEIFEQTVARHGSLNNIDFIFGNSRSVLKTIVPKLDQPAVFWLDSHWSGGRTYGENERCPIIEEINEINRSTATHFLFIDDARLFASPPPLPNRIEYWPSIDAIIRAIQSKENRYYIVIFEDVIIAVPQYAKETVANYCQKTNTNACEGNVTNDKSSTVGGRKQGATKFFDTAEYSLTSHLAKSKLFNSGGVFIDVGANIGNWTKKLLSHKDDIVVHLFEPAPHTYQSLLRNLSEPIKTGRLFPNNCAIGQKEGLRPFYYYEDSPSWSTFYRRPKVEKQYNFKPPKLFSVRTTTLDTYSKLLNITHIRFLKIDAEGAELDVLHGAEKLLTQGLIDFIQFEYGGTFLDAGITLQQIFEFLSNCGYVMFKLLPSGLEYKPQFHPSFEDFKHAGFFAANGRLQSIFLNEASQMLNLKTLCKKHTIIPRGIIHIGAHEGNEIDKYLKMGVEKILFIEANPVVFERLQENIANLPNVQAVNCAISNKCGSITLHVTSNDQSSSILPLKRHKEIYPDIKETHQVTVTSKTLDALLQELQVSPSEFNILNMDIQGAELFALQGASDTLKQIEAINTEVNCEELYEGCAIIDQLDEFLDKRGFERVATTTPYHPSWGDAFYTRKPVITMSTLGQNGRFANQIFQYAFLRIYAKQYNLRVETPEWIGRRLFEHNDPLFSRQLPVIRQETHKLSEDPIPNAKKPFKDVDFWGYFQYHTSYYAPYKEYFRSLFKPVPDIEAKLENAYNTLRAMGNTVIGLHLRRSDYGYDYFFVAPNEWYKDWLESFWNTLDNPVLFIASDEPDKVIGDFGGYNPMTAKDLGIELSEADFYPDFYMLCHCDGLAISNSSFSFAAAMLNERAKFFVRPHLPTKMLIPFDPWDSETIFRDARVEGYQQNGKSGPAPSHLAPVTAEHFSPPKTYLSEKKHFIFDKVESNIQSGFEVKGQFQRDIIQSVGVRPLCLFLNVYYQGFMENIYRKNAQLLTASYRKQKNSLQNEFFGDSDFYSEGLKKAGWHAEDLIINCQPLQQAWARENNFSGKGFEIAIEQIRRAKPQIVYFQVLNVATRDFLSAIRPYTEIVAGQIASPVPAKTDISGFDIILSSFPHFVQRFRQSGITSYYQPLAFDSRVLEKIDGLPRIYPVTFVGGISLLHRKGTAILEKLAERIPIDFWGYGAESLAEDSPIRSRHHGEAWGLDMFSLLSQSQITINRHIDVAENYANNVRLFEATGCGALLITEHRENLSELFEIGKEVVCYRSFEECAELVKYYLAHPKEAQKIALAGQERTLLDHTFTKRMQQTSEILEHHLRYKKDSNDEPKVC